MAIDVVKRIVLFVLFSLAQGLVLNRIHLFGYATPMLYVYFVLLFPRNYPKWALLLWCFSMGLLIDTFSNTPGVASASLTFLGAVQPYFLMLFVPREAPENFSPSVFSLSFGKYFLYSFSLVLCYCLLFFALEAFSFFNWLHWLISSVASTALTLVLIWVLENFRDSRQTEIQI
jgi:rod shape-determining protein MreD